MLDETRNKMLIDVQTNSYLINDAAVSKLGHWELLESDLKLLGYEFKELAEEYGPYIERWVSFGSTLIVLAAVDRWVTVLGVEYPNLIAKDKTTVTLSNEKGK